jgi:hypothetical protein
MAVKCLKCKHTKSGVSSLHMVSICEKCGNTDKSLFIRVEDEDIDPEKYQKDKEWLEEHREK